MPDSARRSPAIGKMLGCFQQAVNLSSSRQALTIGFESTKVQGLGDFGHFGEALFSIASATVRPRPAVTRVHCHGSAPIGED